MRLAYSVGAVGGGLSPDDHAALVLEAERLGYHSAWSSEIFGTDPVALLAYLAAKTTTIGLGTAVLQAPARAAVATAAAAATLQRLSGGRLRLGLGVSGPQVVEGWYGLPFQHPLARLRDYVEILRLALAGEPVAYQGATISVPLPGSEAQPIALPGMARLAPVPLYLAGVGRRSIELAAELAEGWLGIHCPPEYVSEAARHIASSAGLPASSAGLPASPAGLPASPAGLPASPARLPASPARLPASPAGRDPDGFDLAVMVLVLVDDDLELARDMVRPVLALYLGGMGTPSVNYYNRLAGRLGFAAEARAVHRAYLDGRTDEAIAAVTDELVDAMSVCGPPDRVRDRLAAYDAAGASTLIAGFVDSTRPGRMDQLGRLAELADLTGPTLG